MVLSGNMSDLIYKNSLSFFGGYLKKLDTTFHIETPVEWCEENRTMPVGGSPYPGKIDMDILPHHKEIINCAHPDSPVKRISIMKSVQAGLTTSIESIVGFAIKNKLHNILMLISSKNIGKMRGSAALDTMIDNSGLAQYIKPMSNRTDRKSGDSVMYKEFGSHRLMITSYQSIADLKSLSWDLIILDELTECPHGDFRKQGDVESIIHGRVKAMRNAKIFKFSTPETVGSCRIYNNFKDGDQRFWFVPCPLCGDEQILVLKAEGRDYGLTAKYETNKQGKPVVIEDSIHYICQHCKKKLYEYQKPDMMSSGFWKPTAIPIDPNFRSYHVSGLMSPIMFYPFKSIMSEFGETNFGKNIMKFKGFVNNTLGWAWENRAKKKDSDYLYDRRMLNQDTGIVPPGGLVITGGVDVQKDRLELQLVAWGRGMESFSFEHKVFFGDTSHSQNDVWNALNDYVIESTFSIWNKEKGAYTQDAYIARIAVDTGHNPGNYRVKDWGQKAHVVYNFVSRNPMFIAIKGIHDKKDTFLIQEKRTYNAALTHRYDINVSLIKDNITNCIELDNGPYAMHFVNYPEEFFKQFLSEVYAEIEAGKWGWKKTYDRNETWDTFIYARAAAEQLNLSSYTDLSWDNYEESLFG
jgi:phage terminase large subunit GpA-like protein